MDVGCRNFRISLAFKILLLVNAFDPSLLNLIALLELASCEQGHIPANSIYNKAHMFFILLVQIYLSHLSY